MEQKLQQKNVRGVWKDLNMMSGHENKVRRYIVPGGQTWVDGLHLFFNRFDAGSNDDLEHLPQSSLPQGSPIFLSQAISSSIFPISPICECIRGFSMSVEQVKMMVKDSTPMSHSANRRPSAGTRRRQAKYGGCSENHGIRPPAPEQYLTPLQQKEVCIRHLRARLKENVERLQDRDSEVGELRMQLSRMQEDWIEEECHRIEAQLALKEARKEIQQLQQAVESVRSKVGHQDSDQQTSKTDGARGVRVEPRLGASRSCGCSPAHTIGRSATFGRLSSETLPGIDRNGNVTSEQRVHHIPANRGAATLPRGDGRPRLILEASLLSDQAPPMMMCSNLSRSSTYDKLCSGETVVPVGRRCCISNNNNCSCAVHSCLPHHHLFLHLPQQEAPPPSSLTPPPVPPSSSEASNKPSFRSQACSPTISWIPPEEEEEEGEELSVITLATTAPDISFAEPRTISVSSSTIFSTQKSYLPEPLPSDNHVQIPSSQTASQLPQIQQPSHHSPPSPDQLPQTKEEDGVAGSTEEDEGQEQDRHWSRYFLVDLLAVVVPIAPTLAWLCRGRQRDTMPAYHMGSLLRGCCAVALHSLRRVNSTRSRGPSGTGGATVI
ncbi:syntaphilin-like [Silurus asotus]|uniref:Syntaphilin-like n=1 Tax=Silurus asotus TaxID=30991 RepID=A0AAD5AT23_SILAS|nr:syntaphilin-like [Silurus asotus]